MKKLILLLTICTLISSCGLFRKTTKTVNSSEHIEKVEQFDESKKKENESSFESSQKKEAEKSSERDQRDLDSHTSIEAEKITIDKSGNIIAEGGVKLTNNKKDRGKSEKESNRALESTNNKNTKKASSEELKSNISQQAKRKDVVKDSVSEPSSKGIIFGTIGVLIVIVGLLWWFGVKHKS